MYRRLNTCLLLFGAVSAPAAAQNAAPAAGAAPVTISVYAGDINTVSLGPWGSGRAEASKEPVLIGSNSIRVTTQGFYQGARIDLKSPVDLTPAWNNPKTYLRFQVRFSGAGATQAVYDPVSGETRQSANSPFNRMRFLLTMADNTRFELVRPIEVQPSEDPDAWTAISIPVGAVLRKAGGDALPTPMGEGAKLAQIALFGDRYEQFHIGEINIITDETEIDVEPLPDQIAFVRDELTFTGSAQGGTSTLRYSWDFDGDKQEDSTGRVVRHFWRRPGKYEVTLTVSDVDSLKKPASASVTIDVSE